MRRRKDEGAYIVTGPHEPEKHVLSVGMGISVAYDHCRKRRKEDGAFTYYIRDVLGSTTYGAVTKREDGIITFNPAVLAA